MEKVHAIPIIKKRGKNVNAHVLRKIDNDGNESGDADETVVVQSSTTKTAENGSSSLTSASSMRSVAVATAIFDSNRAAVPHQYAGHATAVQEIDTSADRDARALMEKKLSAEDISRKKVAGTFGPMRAPAFLRATSRFDYQPDICKDYKETGFCGYGDNCKFLHDRSDYKAGWQLEKEWDEKQNAKKRKLEQAARSGMAGIDGQGCASDGEEEDYEIKDEEEFPFACHICREEFVDPVVTVCGHYFCKPCITTRSKSTAKCIICNSQTHGIFNPARKLIRHMDALRKKNGGESNDNGDPHFSAVAKCSSKVAPNSSAKGSWEDVDS
jgi:RING finger protein 113A